MAATKTANPVIRRPRDDRDGAWKEILGRRFPQALAFFQPEAYAQIDWERGVEFLQQELREAARVAAKGRRVVDVLARVWLKDGEDAWVLLHVEVQSHPDPNFDQRMFIYNTVLFARHRGPIVSMGVAGYPMRMGSPATTSTGSGAAAPPWTIRWYACSTTSSGGMNWSGAPIRSRW